MNFGCTLEMINMRTSGPNSMQMLSRSYWRQMFKMVSAAGFKGIELPYTPFNSEPIAFEIGRSGTPISTYAVETMYGSVPAFKEMLGEIGIDEVTSVHIKAGDALMELVSAQQDTKLFFEKFDSMAQQAIDFLVQIGGKCLIMSPSPDLGMVEAYIEGGKEGPVKDATLAKIIDVVNKIAEDADKKGIQVAVNNEFYSLIHGPRVHDFMSKIDKRIKYSPDLAHIAIGGLDVIETIKQYKDRLAFVRFSDTAFEDKERNFIKLNPEIPVVGPQKVFSDMGDGKIDLPAVYKTLKEIGYDGWIICDSKRTLNVYRALLKMRWYVDHVIKKA